jgi:hypothetical protein
MEGRMDNKERRNKHRDIQRYERNGEQNEGNTEEWTRGSKKGKDNKKEQ